MTRAGTRPPLISEVEIYEYHHKSRLAMKPGMELTKSKSLSNFKADFRKMKEEQCRNTLERHKINVDRLWTTNDSVEFDFAEKNSELIKK